MKPWVPSVGAAHWWQSGVSPPAIEEKLPVTVRVSP